MLLVLLFCLFIYFCFFNFVWKTFSDGAFFGFHFDLCFKFFQNIYWSVALYHFPQYEHVLHNIVFPLVIYGIVFLLWILWVTKISGYKSKKLLQNKKQLVLILLFVLDQC